MADKKDAAPPPAEPAGVPTDSGGGMYVAGAVILLLGIGGLIYAGSGDDPPPQPDPIASATTPSAAASPSGGLAFAPPPPPEEEDEDDEPEPDASASATAKGDGDAAPATGKAPVGGGPCAKCGEGEAGGGVTSAVSQTAGLARGCYNRSLRQGGSEGTITVSVSIGATGGVCGARIVSDSTNNPALASCVLSKFQSRTYPKPNRGCVVINVPISFSVKR